MMRWMLTIGNVHPMSVLITDLCRISGLYSLIPELVIHDLDGMLDNLLLSWWLFVLFFVSLTGRTIGSLRWFSRCFSLWAEVQVFHLHLCWSKSWFSYSFSAHPHGSTALLFKVSSLQILPLMHRAVQCLHLLKTFLPIFCISLYMWGTTRSLTAWNHAWF